MNILKRLVRLLLFVLLTLPGVVLTILFRVSVLILSLFIPMVGLLLLSRKPRRT